MVTTEDSGRKKESCEDSVELVELINEGYISLGRDGLYADHPKDIIELHKGGQMVFYHLTEKRFVLDPREHIYVQPTEKEPQEYTRLTKESKTYESLKKNQN